MQHAPLRVDAQRNLEHVLRAAREVFSELGYGAPMEDVARRARVGVGTVYRRFPSKDVLVRRIAEEETARLTEQARTALGEEDDPWAALSRFLRTSVTSGAGRLLPPRVLHVGGEPGPVPSFGPDQRATPGAVDRKAEAVTSASPCLQGAPPAVGRGREVPPDVAGPRTGSYSGNPTTQRAAVHGLGSPAGNSEQALKASQAAQGSAAEPGVPQQGEPLAAFDGQRDEPGEDGGAAALLSVVGQLVERARTGGELRADVGVPDVLLVMATSAPSLPEPAQHAAAAARLLEILLAGLRSHQQAGGGPGPALNQP
jgi:AcrR family transcriptional regulator